MEVVEIISHYVNRANNILNVVFRLRNDEYARQDIIEFGFFEEFGYDTKEIFDFTDNDDDDDDDDNNWNINDYDDNLDEDGLLSFLNEFYIVFPDRLPEEEYC